MKKIFISCPMRGLTTEEIIDLRERMETIAVVLLDENVDVVNPYDPKLANVHPLIALGRSIEKMATADYLVCPDVVYRFKGVNAEYETWITYKDPQTVIDIDLKHTKQIKKLEALDKEKEE